MKDAAYTLKIMKIDVNNWSNYVEVSKIKVGFITENILKGHLRWVTETFITSDKSVEIFWQTLSPLKCQIVRHLSTFDPILVLENKDKSTLKLTNEVMTETKRLDESVCDSILHEFSNLFD